MREALRHFLLENQMSSTSYSSHTSSLKHASREALSTIFSAYYACRLHKERCLDIKCVHDFDIA